MNIKKIILLATIFFSAVSAQTENLTLQPNAIFCKSEAGFDFALELIFSKPVDKETLAILFLSGECLATKNSMKIEFFPFTKSGDRGRFLWNDGIWNTSKYLSYEYKE
jgi:hypothetical protein